MKKLLIYILSIILMFSLFGCKKEESKKEEEQEKEKFVIKAATNIVEVYMRDLIMEDVENVKKHLSEELLKGNKFFEENEMKLKGFNIEEVNEIGESGIFKLKAVRVNIKEPNTSLDEYTIKVIKEGEEYKISDIVFMTDREAFLENGKIRIRIKDNVKTNLLIDKSGVPLYAFPQDDKAKINKLLVPKQNFGALCFSYTGNSVGLVTKDDSDSFVSIVNIDETLAVQGENGGGAGGAGGGGSQGDGGLQIDMGEKETPIGKEVVSVDLLKNCMVDFMVFTNDEKYLIVQYTQKDVGKNVRVYKTDSGDIIDIKFEDIYPLDKVDVKFSSTDKDSIIYEVVSKDEENMDNEYIGKWKLNLEEMKTEKL